MIVRALMVFSFALLFLSPAARAEFLIEPYVGYELGTYKSQLFGSESPGDAKGVTVGGRLGLSLPLFFVALDYSLMSGQMKTERSTQWADVTTQRVFAVGGAALPLVRVYGGLGFWNELSTKIINSDVKISGMPSVKLGASFTGIPLVALNLEYIYVKYDKISAGSYSGSIDLATSTFLASVSVPLEL